MAVKSNDRDFLENDSSNTSFMVQDDAIYGRNVVANSWIHAWSVFHDKAKYGHGVVV